MLNRLHPLNRKLLRDLWHIKSQALAIALVIGAGIGMYVMARGMLFSLESTRDAYYDRYRFAHLWAPARRAPDSLLQDIQRIPGVRRAETRIRAPVLMSVAGVRAPIAGVMQSLPAAHDTMINGLVLVDGRWPDNNSSDQVLLLEGFANAHQLKPGDQLSALLNGHQRPLEVAGLVLAPEYVYAMAPGEMVPDPARFGVAWLPRQALASAFDLDGAFNEAVLLISRGAVRANIVEELDRLLEPFGASGAHGRELQMSDRFLANEIQQLGVMAWLLPPIFLLVAAFLLNVVISRLIDTEREQIGLLKAFGYSHATVARHYLKLTAAITVMGVGVGFVLGYELGGGLAILYQEYFKFPFLLFTASSSIYASAALISVIAGGLGSLGAVTKVMRLQPAVAMVPAAPPSYSRSPLLDRLGAKLDQPSRMILRHISRWPGRAMMTVTGIAMSMGLLIGSSFSLDAMDYMIDVSFNVMNRQDATVTFNQPRHGSALQELLHEPQVLSAEPFRAVDAVLRHGRHQRREAIIGLSQTAELSRLTDVNLEPVLLPDTGIVLSDKLAELLDLQVGDLLDVEISEGRRPKLRVPVTGISTTYMGTGAYMALPALNRLLRQDGQISGIHLLLDSRKQDALFDHLKALPSVAGISLQDQSQRAFDDAMQENLGTFTFFNTLFAALIAIGVVYNNARVSLSERGRELASLRVLGLSRADVSYILLGELALLTLLALPFGAGLGWLLAHSMVVSFDTDLFRIPMRIDLSTYGYGALVIILAAIVSGLLVRRRIDTLDLVAVLKTRE